ncbi:MAG TPA: iron-containing redox enzyme family protein [Kofleriaceae bacterium]
MITLKRSNILSDTTSRPETLEVKLAELRKIQAEHPFWSNPLLVGLAQGAFTKDDLRFVYSQYHHYSKNFTRFIAAVMANCESDLFRAQLSENLWEEGGGCEPDRRHAQIFRNFLQTTMGIENPDTIEYEPYTRHFVREFLVQSLRASPMAGAAFLSLGTEGIVARMYEVMVAGLRKAGIPDQELEFFHIHIGCDDEHAVTLENMMASYADEPGWYDVCLTAMNQALDLRDEFFRSMFDSLQKNRLVPMLGRVQKHTSLAKDRPDSALCYRKGQASEELYQNEVEKLNVKFFVQRLPLEGDVLDPRMVHIPAGKFNENHKHAHETLIHIMEGSGQVVIDGRTLPVKAGDTVLVPRWAMHQTQNLGATDMRFLAVTDFNFTKNAYLGNATDYRMHEDADARRKH